MPKTLRFRTRTGWVTKPVGLTPENRLTAEEVDDNFLTLEDQISDVAQDLVYQRLQILDRSDVENYVLSLGDAGGWVRVNRVGASVVTVPSEASVAFPLGSRVWVRRAGAGALTFAGASGVTLNSAGPLEIPSRHGTAQLIKIDTDVWDVHIDGVSVSEEGTDPLFGAVVLLVQPEGPTGRRAFLDYSHTRKPVGGLGGAQISTAVTIEDRSTVYLDGSGALLVVGPTYDLSFGTGDFCVEAQIYITGGQGSDRGITDFRNSSGSDTGTFFIDGPAGNKLAFWFGQKLGGTGASLQLNTHYWVALERQGGTTRCFIDGVEQWSSNVPYTFAAPRTLGIGGAVFTSGVGQDAFTGHIGQVRITHAARYGAAYTPPTGLLPRK